MSLSNEIPLHKKLRNMIEFIKQALSEGLVAFKKNLLPASILWFFGICVLCTYYFIPELRWIFDSVEELKNNTGLYFLFFSTGFFGAILPALFSTYILKQYPFPYIKTFVLFLFWAIKGIEVEYFYRFQHWAFQDNILLKIAFDEFIYVPLWGLASVALFYYWVDCDYSIKTFKQKLGKHWYRDRIARVLIPNWSVWIPAVCIIYLLPQPLQLPLQNITLAFWVMILAYLTTQKTNDTSKTI